MSDEKTTSIIKKPKTLKRAKATSSANHYLTNAQLLPAVRRAQEVGKVTDELAKMFMQLAEHISKKSWYAGYTYREDMVASALVNLCINGLKFNCDKSNNPFSYYSTAIMRSFSHYKSDEKKQRNIRDLLLIEAGSNPSNTFTDQNHDGYRQEHADFFDNY